MKSCIFALYLMAFIAIGYAAKTTKVTSTSGNGCAFKNYEGGDRRQYLTYTKDGSACHFPFIKDGSAYSTCQDGGDSGQWCSTSASYSSSNKKTCALYAVGTYDGNGEGRPCKFPFNYKGEEKRECLSKDGYKWCATTSDFDRDEKWGKCYSGDGPATIDGNAQGQQCHFPFVYEGETYNKCLKRDDYEWCAVTGNFDADGIWGKCLREEDVERLPTITAAVPSSAVVEASGGSASDVVKHLPNAANGLMHTVNLLKGFDILKNTAPFLGPALGLLGVGFGVLNLALQVTPAMIIEKVNEAIDKLVEELDQRLEQVLEFAENEDLEHLRNIRSSQYRADQRSLTDLLALTDKAEVDRQLSYFVTLFSGHREFYMQSLRYGQNPDRALSRRDVKVAEVQLPILKKHIDMHLLASAALINTTKDANLTNKLRGLRQKFIDDVDEYSEYIQWAYKQILDRRVSDQKFSGNKAYTCHEAKQEFHYTWGFGRNEKYMEESKQRCDFKCTNFRRDFTCSVHMKFTCGYQECYMWSDNHPYDTPGFQQKASQTATSVCKTYLDRLDKHVKNFWQREVLDYIPVWKAASHLQQKELDKMPALDATPQAGGGTRRAKVNARDTSVLQDLDEARRKIQEGLTADMSFDEYAEKARQNAEKLIQKTRKAQKRTRGVA